ncbi:hypothetical protein [Jeotgalibaca caeni]|uniref:hypothetical protein n=1 Tax=Jeotgalibaca caeni TaxID=3028623 RepID=UPI00237E5F4B|nr:hypothetical protein [Jeotgalibaca caeni]MDE1549950.1 hypothetical protein [Jeotgalibaca caeni]
MKKTLKNKYIFSLVTSVLAVVIVVLFMTLRSKDVTDSWAENNVLLSQRNYEIAASYQLAFTDSTFIVYDRYVPITSNDAGSENRDLPLEVGEYSPYTVTKKDDVYTIKSGDAINYRLTQTAPRIFVDEIGTEYTTDSYVDDF